MAKFTRQLTEDQLNAICAGLVQGEFPTAIGRRLGIPRETVRDAAKRPEVANLVEAIRAEDAANENLKVSAVSRERKRETSRKSSKTYSAKQKREGFAAERAERGAVAPASTGSADGRILGVFAAPRRGVPGIPDDDGWVVKAGGGGDTMSQDEWRRAERERDPATMRCAAITHIGQYGYLRDDEAELSAAARNVCDDRPDLDRADVLATLREQKEGARFAFPEPDEPEPPEPARATGPSDAERARLSFEAGIPAPIDLAPTP